MANACFDSLIAPDMAGWKLAGNGSFTGVNAAVRLADGPGILWYAPSTYDDFTLCVEWRVGKAEDNSGVFLRIPPLAQSPQPAIDEGYEVQIDERGVDPEHDRCDSPLHLTGAIYGLAPARAAASRPIGQWNAFEIVAEGRHVAVWLNGVLTAAFDAPGRRRRGHIGLQCHHPGSAVWFRNLLVGAR